MITEILISLQNLWYISSDTYHVIWGLTVSRSFIPIMSKSGGSETTKFLRMVLRKTVFGLVH